MSQPQTTPRRDPLAPVETVISLVLTLCATLLVLQVVLSVAAAFDPDATVGPGPTCAVVGENERHDLRAEGASQSELGFSDGVATYEPENVEVCLDDPNGWQAGAGVVVGSIGFLEFAVAIFLLRRVVRTARRDGLFVPATVGEIRRLGHVLLAFVVLGPLVTVAGTWVVVAPTDVSVDLPDLLVLVGVPWVLLLVAAGVVTVARVLDHAAELQDDVDHTV
ncbi:DUF2975 domain-containing protein [Nocardioides marinquilinus]